MLDSANLARPVPPGIVLRVRLAVLLIDVLSNEQCRSIAMSFAFVSIAWFVSSEKGRKPRRKQGVHCQAAHVCSSQEHAKAEHHFPCVAKTKPPNIVTVFLLVTNDDITVEQITSFKASFTGAAHPIIFTFREMRMVHETYGRQFSGY